ncbi:two-component sensor histidine kinase, partial [Streptomyces albiflaviniger]|nr:two-component sensor histidine kinase [Streptomyces albiflaviniger]
MRGLGGRLSPRGLRGRLSLRGRLLAIALMLLVAALLGSNALAVVLLKRDLVHQLDNRLRTAATAAARLTDPSDTAGDRTSRVRDTVEQQLTGDVYLASLG